MTNPGNSRTSGHSAWWLFFLTNGNEIDLIGTGSAKRIIVPMLLLRFLTERKILNPFGVICHNYIHTVAPWKTIRLITFLLYEQRLS